MSRPNGTDPAARTFALIDHSLTSPLGHNLTYARRVLCAASLQGYRVIAGVGGDGGGQDVCAQSLAMFPRNVWSNNPAEGRRWHAAAAVGRLLSRDRPALRPGDEAQVAAPEVSPSPLPGDRLSRLTQGLRQDGAALLAARSAARRFGDELAAFVDGATLSPGDIVYMPTVLAAEVQGLERLLDRSDLARRLCWRLMLRYSPQARSVRTSLAAAVKRLHRRAEVDARFFSDTEPLCEMYQRLCGAPFDLLPVPVDGEPVVRALHDGPLVIGYFGDARDEKGFDLLPEIIRCVRADATGHRSIRFAVQVNLNTAEGDARTRAARAKLVRMQAEDLELIDGPLTPRSYGELFDRTAVVLLPYQPGPYVERSSGILMEAVMAGLPCIVTRGGWMQAVLDSAPAETPAGLATEARPQALADAVLRIAADWSLYAKGAQALRQTLRPRYDPAELVRKVAET